MVAKKSTLTDDNTEGAIREKDFARII